MASTRTLQSDVNVASTHGELMPLAGVGGYTSEPALSICNTALQELLSHPHDFKFNRVEMPFFVTAPFQQDYLFAGATAFQIGATGAVSAGAQIAITSGVTVAAGVVTVNILPGQNPHQLTVGQTVFMQGVVMTTGTTANYNSTLSQTTAAWTWTGGWVITVVTATSFSFAAITGQNNSDAGGAPGITDFGWLASCTATQLGNTSPVGNIRPMEAVRNLAPCAVVNRPTKICVLKTYQATNGTDTGVLKIRLESATGADAWIINPVYQAKPPIKTDLSNTWAPVPDEYGFLTLQAVLAGMYRYLNSPQQVPEYQKLQAAINKATGADDRETSDVHVVPESSLVDSTWYGWTF